MGYAWRNRHEERNMERKKHLEEVHRGVYTSKERDINKEGYTRGYTSRVLVLVHTARGTYKGVVVCVCVRSMVSSRA